MESIKCRECGKDLSSKAVVCPHCGIMYPGNPAWKGWGIDKKSEGIIGGLPLYHISFGIDEKGKIRRAEGFFAIGQFARGYFVLAQFGIAYIFGIGQGIISPVSIAQLALGLLSVGQIAIGIVSVGQFAAGIYSLCQMGFALNLLSMTHKDQSAVEFFRPFIHFIKNIF